MVGCTGEVYDQRAAQVLAQELLVTDPAQHPGNGYVLVGTIATAVTQATADTKGSVSLLVHAEGIWVYQFNTAQRQALVKLIVGKSQKAAQSLLLQQDGVEKTTIHLFGGNGSMLPTDQSQITLAVLSVPGLQQNLQVP
jgi:VCBS repeat-containing protein